MHRRLTNLPEGDVIVHSGDFTMMGTEGEALDFMEWFCDLPHRHKVFIAGNHDFCLRGARLEGLDENCHYLCNSGVQIDGVKFYGVPMFFEDAINRRAENDFMNIPPDTDVLVTHTPPYGILDRDAGILYGSRELLEKVRSARPRLHLFGHIHKAHGTIDDGSTVFSNAAIMDENYDSLGNPVVLTVSVP